MKNETTPRAKLIQQLTELDNRREQIGLELQKEFEREAAIVNRADVLHMVLETARQKLAAGKNHFEQVKEQCGDGSLSWGHPNFSGHKALSIVSASETRKKVEAEFSAWLVQAEAEEKAALKALSDYAIEHRTTFENLSGPHNNSTFTRGLPGSLAPYLNPKN
jgi:hypothetical protein